MKWTHHGRFKLLQLLQFFELGLKLLLLPATVFKLFFLQLESLVLDLQELFGLLLLEAHLLQHFLHLQQFFFERLLLLWILFFLWGNNLCRLFGWWRNWCGYDDVSIVRWWGFLLQGPSAPSPLCGYFSNNCATHRWNKRERERITEFYFRNELEQWVSVYLFVYKRGAFYRRLEQRSDFLNLKEGGVRATLGFFYYLTVGETEKRYTIIFFTMYRRFWISEDPQNY